MLRVQKDLIGRTSGCDRSEWKLISRSQKRHEERYEVNLVDGVQSPVRGLSGILTVKIRFVKRETHSRETPQYRDHVIGEFINQLSSILWHQRR